MSLMVMLALTLTACSVGRVGPPATLFDLGPERDASTVVLPARIPIVLAYSATPALQNDGVIWRVGTQPQPRSYAGFRWSEPPATLVYQRLLERLSRAGPVLTDSSVQAPQLRVSLMRFEQVFAADGSSSTGQILLQVILLRKGQVIDQLHVAQSASAPAQDAAGGVAALRIASDAAADQIAAWLARLLPPATGG